MYIFIDENTVEKYNDENLKRYVGKKLVKVISNPTDEDLLEFGYKYLVEDEQPKCQENEYLSYHYELQDNTIYKRWTVQEIKVEENERL